MIDNIEDLLKQGFPVRQVAELADMSPAWVRGFARDRNLKPKPVLRGKSRAQVRRFLLAYRGHRCEQCGTTTWNKHKVPLQMHHIDGNTENNSLDNLLLLCVNCHAQTPNFGAKNRKK